MCSINLIKEKHPEHADKILTPETWNWEDWLPFWTEDESEKYIFEDNYLEFFGPEASPIKSSVEDWELLKSWASRNGHELVLVSAQRPHCEDITREWLEKYGFDFDEIHFTKLKQLIDVDVLIDDSPEKLDIFKDRSIERGNPICYRQTWNKECQEKYMTIDRLSDIIGKVFG